MDDTSVNKDRPGLVLVNLGTPDRPDTASVRRYLDQFLSDRRVIEIPALLWQPFLKAVILRRRPQQTAANYQKIWDQKTNQSPLRQITAEQAAALQQHFGARVQVRYAMRYGNPGLEAGLQGLIAAGCTRICVAPLYPQYSSATTGTVLAEVFRILGRLRHIPALQTLAPYYQHPAYIEALQQSLQQNLAKLDFTPEKILLSFHGMPERTTELGDPYADHCHATARLLRAATGHSESQMPICFQSRFGPAKWLQPYLLPLVEQLAKGGARRIAVMTPGFSADCIETLEEVDMQVCAAFLQAGGTHFAAIPCLNASAPGLDMLRRLAEQALGSWLDD